jgi:hypothetical protein
MTHIIYRVLCFPSSRPFFWVQGGDTLDCGRVGGGTQCRRRDWHSDTLYIYLYAMPCPCRYFIILYNSMFVTVFLEPKGRWRGGGGSFVIFYCLWRPVWRMFQIFVRRFAASALLNNKASSLLRLRISLGLNDKTSKPYSKRDWGAGGGGRDTIFYSVGLCVLLFPSPNPLTTNKITRIDVCFLSMFFTNFLPTKHFSSFMFRMFPCITRQLIILTPHIFSKKS